MIRSKGGSCKFRPFVILEDDPLSSQRALWLVGRHLGMVYYSTWSRVRSGLQHLLSTHVVSMDCRAVNRYDGVGVLLSRCPYGKTQSSCSSLSLPNICRGTLGSRTISSRPVLASGRSRQTSQTVIHTTTIGVSSAALACHADPAAEARICPRGNARSWHGDVLIERCRAKFLFRRRPIDRQGMARHLDTMPTHVKRKSNRRQRTTCIHGESSRADFLLLGRRAPR